MKKEETSVAVCVNENGNVQLLNFAGMIVYGVHHDPYVNGLLTDGYSLVWNLQKGTRTKDEQDLHDELGRLFDEWFKNLGGPEDDEDIEGEDWKKNL